MSLIEEIQILKDKVKTLENTVGIKPTYSIQYKIQPLFIPQLSNSSTNYLSMFLDKEMRKAHERMMFDILWKNYAFYRPVEKSRGYRDTYWDKGNPGYGKTNVD